MTPLWTGAALAHAVDGAFAGPPPAAITGISIDTRTLAPGDLFVALATETGDGHDHVAAALAKGAAAALVHRDAGSDPRLLRVGDTFAALQALGAAARARFRGRVVAVTGSVGKTTTKDMLRIALSATGATHAAQASYNNHWGVPLTLARMAEHDRFAVIEIGMNHPGEIAPLAALARPQVAIVTSIATSHIGAMGSLDAIALEKSALFGALDGDGVAIFPADAAHVERLEQAAGRVGARCLRIGREVQIGGLELRADGSSAGIVIAGRTIALHLAAPGRHLVDNAAACLAAVAALGADPAQAAAALAGFSPGAGRGALRPILDGAAFLLDESYNASRASVAASLAVLKLLPATRRVAVLGDMLELGAFARDEHENLNRSVRESADVVYCSGAMMKHLFDTLPLAIRGAHAADARALAPIVRDAVRPGDVVLIKGSNGSRMRDIVAVLTAPARAG